MSFDWNGTAENAMAGALGMVPEVGSLLSALTYIFWPKSGENVWAEIEQQVEQLIHQEIDKLVYEQVQNSLSGLYNNLGDYLSAVQTVDYSNISATWITTDGDFDQQLPSFQAAGYELLLLPLFAQFANLNLTLLRDGVLYGSQWGWNTDYQSSIAQKLTGKITTYVEYAKRIYQQGYQNVIDNPPKKNYHECQPFRFVNAFVRQMTLGVLDFMQLWPYFDTTEYPNPVSVYLDREIYSDPVGTCDNSGPINLPSPPTQPISQITVWAWDRIDAVQLTYPEGAGPGGVTQTARMGDQKGGSDHPPYGGVFNVNDNPVTVAAGLAGDILNAFTFTFKDGTNTGKLGGNYGGGEAFSFSYAGEILSSIHINGVSNFYGSADCAVFGFKYQQSQTPNLDTLRLMYITSPSYVTLNNLALQSVTQSITVTELTMHASTEDWDTQRQEYWEYLKSRMANRPTVPIQPKIIELPISTAWMYMSDNQQYNTIPPTWSAVNFKDADVLNVGPAGVQPDGTFGLYNSPDTGDLATRFKWIIQTARNQNPKIKIIISQWWGNGDCIWGNALDALTTDTAVSKYTNSVIAFLQSYLGVSGGVDGYDIDYESNNVVASISTITSQIRAGMDALSNANGGRPFYLTMSPANTTYLDKAVASLNFVNMQTYAGGSSLTPQNFIELGLKPQQLLYGICPETNCFTKSVSQVKAAYIENKLAGIHLWRLNSNNYCEEGQVQAQIYSFLHQQ